MEILKMSKTTSKIKKLLDVLNNRLDMKTVNLKIKPQKPSDLENRRKIIEKENEEYLKASDQKV